MTTGPPTPSGRGQQLRIGLLALFILAGTTLVVLELATVDAVWPPLAAMVGTVIAHKALP